MRGIKCVFVCALCSQSWASYSSTEASLIVLSCQLCCHSNLLSIPEACAVARANVFKLQAGLIWMSVLLHFPQISCYNMNLYFCICESAKYTRMMCSDILIGVCQKLARNNEMKNKKKEKQIIKCHVLLWLYIQSTGCNKEELNSLNFSWQGGHSGAGPLLPQSTEYPLWRITFQKTCR